MNRGFSFLTFKVTDLKLIPSRERNKNYYEYFSFRYVNL